MKWYITEIKKPDEDQKVLATDGKNSHIAIYIPWMDKENLACYQCDYSCRVKESLYWTDLQYLTLLIYRPE